jgi:hypothetical protein
MADVIVNGAFFSSSNMQLRVQAVGGGSNLFTSFDSLNLEDEVDPVLVHAIGSVGAIGATDGTYKASGGLEAPTAAMQYLWNILSAADPTGSKSPSRTIFNITGIVTNNVDPSYKLEVRKCRLIKLSDAFKGGDPKQLTQPAGLLIIDGIYRNGVRLLNPQPAQGIR